jgi:hypothetical protein
MKSKYLMIKPINGLANRLRVLFSYKIIAEYLKLPYYVYWTKSSGFDDTPLADLISVSNIDFLSGDMWSKHRPLSFQVDRRISETSEFKLSLIGQKKGKSMANLLMSKSITKISAEVSNLPNWSFNDALISKIPNHKKLYKNLVSSFSVSDNIKTESQKILNLYENNVLGVHLRFGDATDSKNLKHRMHTKNKLEKIIEVCKKHIGQVFVSTDDQDVLEYFISRLHKKLLYREKKIVRSELNEKKEGQFDAMTDLYLLSKSNLMYPTSPSSFGKFASDMGNNLYGKCDYENIQNFGEFSEIIRW